MGDNLQGNGIKNCDGDFKKTWKQKPLSNPKGNDKTLEVWGLSPIIGTKIRFSRNLNSVLSSKSKA
jgi:hypothetical protein